MDHDESTGASHVEHPVRTGRWHSKWPWLILATLAVAYVVRSQRSVLQPGGPAPDIAVTDWINAGSDFDPETLQGRVVVLEFWATWCPPCVQSIPHLNAVHRRFRDQGVVVIGVTDEAAATVRPFVRQHGIEYTIGLGGRLDRAYGVRYLPTAVVIDRTGHIAWTGYPDDQLDRAVAEVVSGP